MEADSRNEAVSDCSDQETPNALEQDYFEEDFGMAKIHDLTPC